MKCLVVLIIALVAFVAAHEEHTSNSLAQDLTPAQVHEYCVQHTGVTAEQLLKFRRTEHSDDNQVHKYVLCNLKKSGFFTEESGHNVDRIIAGLIEVHLDEEKAREIVTKCADRNEQNSPPEVWAYRCVECLYENKIEDLVNEAKRKAHNKSENKAD